MEIGQKLKDKRTASNLSQEELAKHLGVTRQTISSWENNRSYPDIGSILKLSDLYDISLDELLKEDEKMKKHMEQVAEWSNKYWTLLIDIAIVLYPVSILLYFWEFSTAAVVARWAGMIMLIALFTDHWKQTGGNKWELIFVLVVWGMSVAEELIAIFGFHYLTSWNYEYTFLVGYCLLTNYRKSIRFWVVALLCISAPLYVSIKTNLARIGIELPPDPFGHTYCVEEVIEASDENAVPGEIDLIYEDSNYTLVLDDDVSVWLNTQSISSSIKGECWWTGELDDTTYMLRLDNKTGELTLKCLESTSESEESTYTVVWAVELAQISED